jgi:hypothetical protein
VIPIQYKEIDMFTFIKRLPQSTIVGLSGLILAALLAASFATLVAPRIMPQTAQAAVITTCAEAPSASNCNRQDPVLQGCSADARALSQELIVSNGNTIGILQRRYSPACQSWWGRILDNRPESNDRLDITIGDTTISSPAKFTDSQFRILFSTMIFMPLNQAPSVYGTIEVAGANPFPNATIPTTFVPVK